MSKFILGVVFALACVFAVELYEKPWKREKYTKQTVELGGRVSKTTQHYSKVSFYKFRNFINSI